MFHTFFIRTNAIFSSHSAPSFIWAPIKRIFKPGKCFREPLLWILWHDMMENGHEVQNKLNHECFPMFSRMGSVAYDGVARLRRHARLEHVLPHAGHHHPQAEDMRDTRHVKVLQILERGIRRVPGFVDETRPLSHSGFWWRSSHE